MPIRVSSFARLAALFAVVLTLTACANAGRKTYACPNMGILSDASRFHEFRAGGGQDLTDIQYAGEILSIAAECTRHDEGLEAELQVELATQLGPAAPSDEVSFDVFVAIARNDEQVLSKEVRTFEVAFRKSERAVRTLEEFDDIIIPLGEDGTSTGLQILIGYQLSPQQVAYNRARRVH